MQAFLGCFGGVVVVSPLFCWLIFIFPTVNRREETHSLAFGARLRRCVDGDRRLGLLVAVAELFVPVLDDADRGGRGGGSLDRCDRQKSFTVGGDVVAPTEAASRSG